MVSFCHHYRVVIYLSIYLVGKSVMWKVFLESKKHDVDNEKRIDTSRIATTPNSIADYLFLRAVCGSRWALLAWLTASWRLSANCGSLVWLNVFLLVERV